MFFKIDRPCNFEDVRNQEHQNCILYQGNLIENSIGQAFFSTVIEGSVLDAFISKKSEQPLIFNRFILDENELGYGRVMTSYQDLFLGYINAYEVSQFAGSVKNDRKLSKSLSNLLSQNNISNYDNPVLTLTRIRDF